MAPGRPVKARAEAAVGGGRPAPRADVADRAAPRRRAERARSYLLFEEDSFLDLGERADLIRRLLRSPVAADYFGVVLDLLNASSPDELRNLFWDGELNKLLMSTIPQGHPHHKDLLGFVQQRFRPPSAVPRIMGIAEVRPIDRPFQPDMIARSLENSSARANLTPEQFYAAVS